MRLSRADLDSTSQCSSAREQPGGPGWEATSTWASCPSNLSCRSPRSWPSRPRSRRPPERRSTLYAWITPTRYSVERSPDAGFAYSRPSQERSLRGVRSRCRNGSSSTRSSPAPRAISPAPGESRGGSVTNLVLVTRKLATLEEHLRRLRQRRPAAIEAFEQDLLLQDAIAMGILVVVQEAMDIALHLASDEGWTLAARDHRSRAGDDPLRHGAASQPHRARLRHRRCGPDLELATSRDHRLGAVRHGHLGIPSPPTESRYVAMT